MSEAWVVSENVVEEPLEEGLALRRGAELYVLDEIAADLWRLLETGSTTTELIDALSKRYKGPSDQIAEDVIATLEQLATWEVVQRADR